MLYSSYPKKNYKVLKIEDLDYEKYLEISKWIGTKAVVNRFIFNMKRPQNRPILCLYERSGGMEKENKLIKSSLKIEIFLLKLSGFYLHFSNEI